MKKPLLGLYVFLLFIMFCLFNAFPITYISCDKTNDICVCKQFIRSTIAPYKQFCIEPISNIKEVITFGSDGNVKGGYIGVRLKDSKKRSSIGSLVDSRFLYDLFSMKQTKEFADEFNRYLGNDIAKFSHVHINFLSLIIISFIFLGFLLIRIKDNK